MICLLSALQFHRLTTQLPSQVWIAMPRGSHVPRIEHPPIKMVQPLEAGGLEHIALAAQHAGRGGSGHQQNQQNQQKLPTFRTFKPNARKRSLATPQTAPSFPRKR